MTNREIPAALNIERRSSESAGGGWFRPSICQTRRAVSLTLRSMFDVQRRSHLLLALLASFVVTRSTVRADEPFFKKGDVIALVGGEDMVAMSEYGYLELLLTRALPEHRLKFRNLAWEGDTVFEQRRDLNFPTWEQQLDQIGATVVLCQFGQMESLAGKEKLREFVAAYENLLDRFSGGGKRRIVVISPHGFGVFSANAMPEADTDSVTLRERQLPRNSDVWKYANATLELATRKNFWSINALDIGGINSDSDAFRPGGIHLNCSGLSRLAQLISPAPPRDRIRVDSGDGRGPVPLILNRAEILRQLPALIIAKNRLWFDYWRVQNWAFLAGDRTEQPSSRDHVDRTKRWFPAEREQFLPLIEAKEQEIWTLAAKLAQP